MTTIRQLYFITKMPTFWLYGYKVEGSGSQGGGGTLIFSHIRRLGPFFGVQNSEFRYFWGFSEK